MDESSSSRATKYSRAILGVLATLGHATNAELLDELRKEYPTLSATTVHRLTTRLAARNTIGYGPLAPDGSMRYDATTMPHDHFICQGCDRVRDLHVAEELIPRIEQTLDGCMISGRLVIAGTCGRCLQDKSKEEQ